MQQQTDNRTHPEPSILDYIKSGSDFGGIEKQEWLWQGVIPNNALTIIVGDGGVGKTWLVCDILGKHSEKKKSLYLNFEDSVRTNLFSRFKQLGYLIGKIDFLDWAENESDTDLRSKRFKKDIHKLMQAYQNGVIVIDPLDEIMGSRDDYSATEIRSLLSPIRKLAEKYKVAVIGIKHTRKPDKQTQRRISASEMLGSVAFKNVARQVLCTELVNPDEPNGARRLWSDKKNLENVITDALEFHIPERKMGVSKIEYTIANLPTSQPLIGEVVGERILSILEAKNQVFLKDIELELNADEQLSEKAFRKGKEYAKGTDLIEVIRTKSGDLWKLKNIRQAHQSAPTENKPNAFDYELDAVKLGDTN